MSRLIEVSRRNWKGEDFIVKLSSDVNGIR